MFCGLAALLDTDGYWRFLLLVPDGQVIVFGVHDEDGEQACPFMVARVLAYSVM